MSRRTISDHLSPSTSVARLIGQPERCSGISVLRSENRLYLAIGFANVTASACKLQSVGRRFQMANLTYLAIASLDGYVEDEQGKFDWAAPDEEVHAFVNDLERPVGTHLYGDRMYETMFYWETDDEQEAVYRDYAEMWRAAEKVVYSRTLQTASSQRTRIERDFD